MTAIVFDIETWIDWDHLYESGAITEWEAQYAPPQNYRKPLAKAAHKTSEWFALRKASALSPLGANICSIAWCDLRDPADIYAASGSDEVAVIREFASYLKELRPAVLCGYAIKLFDMPFLVVRASATGNELPPWWPSHRSYQQVVDLMDYVPSKTKFDRLAKRFGLPGKTSDGSRIEFMTPEMVASYNRQDVFLEASVARHFAPNIPQLRDSLTDYDTIPDL